MNIMNENGYCPFCETDLDGEDMVDFFVSEGKTLSQAYVHAMVYFRYGDNNTKFTRMIPLYDKNTGKNIGHKCPDCGEEW